MQAQGLSVATEHCAISGAENGGQWVSSRIGQCIGKAPVARGQRFIGGLREVGRAADQ